jgi:predicted  nucleic acid-binding Zn-ribbon protein
MAKVTTATMAVSDKDTTSIEEKLKHLYSLQKIDSQIDKIRIVRGELPLEVADLEDEVAGLQTRLENATNEIKELEEMLANRKIAIKESQELIKKYTSQQEKVRNNREYDSLSKEIEYQNLEIQLSEKRTKEHKAAIAMKSELLDAATAAFDERKADLKHKKAELDDIIAETQKDEESLLKKDKSAESKIDDRLINAYKRIRSNTRNGLALVTVSRDACGGCFNKIPPQTQMDIAQHKKIIVCEHCGRFLVDEDILNVSK